MRKYLSIALLAIALVAMPFLRPVEAAAISTGVTTLYYENGGECLEVLRIANVTSADTIDMSAAGNGVVQYNLIKCASFCVCGSGNGPVVTAMVLGTLSNGAAGVNTKITFTLTSMSKDTIDVFIIGERAN